MTMVSHFSSITNSGCSTATLGIRSACPRLHTLRKALLQHLNPSSLQAKREDGCGTQGITVTLEVLQIQRSCAAVIAAAALVWLHPLAATAQVSLIPACYKDLHFTPTWIQGAETWIPAQSPFWLCRTYKHSHKKCTVTNLRQQQSHNAAGAMQSTHWPRQLDCLASKIQMMMVVLLDHSLYKARQGEGPACTVPAYLCHAAFAVTHQANLLISGNEASCPYLFQQQ